MKTLKISNYSEKNNLRNHQTQDKYYNIYLGNKLTFYFANLVDLKCFRAYISNELDYIIFELIEMYPKISASHLASWIIIENKEQNEKKIKLLNQNTAKLKSILDHIELIFTRAHHTNGNTFVFHWITNIIEHYISIIDLHNEDFKKRYEYLPVKKNIIILNRLNDILKNLSTLGILEYKQKYENKNGNKKLLKIDKFKKMYDHVQLPEIINESDYTQ